jgi:hypothetical protein
MDQTVTAGMKIKRMAFMVHQRRPEATTINLTTAKGSSGRVNSQHLSTIAHLDESIVDVVDVERRAKSCGTGTI